MAGIVRSGSLRDNMGYQVLTLGGKIHYVDIFGPLGSCVSTTRHESAIAADLYLKEHWGVTPAPDF